MKSAKVVESSINDFKGILTPSEVIESKRKSRNEFDKMSNRISSKEMNGALYDMYKKSYEQKTLLDDATSKVYNQQMDSTVRSAGKEDGNWKFPIKYEDEFGKKASGMLEVKKTGNKKEYFFTDEKNETVKLKKGEFDNKLKDNIRNDIEEKYGMDSLYTITADDGSKLSFVDSRTDRDPNKEYNDGKTGINVYYTDASGHKEQLTKTEVNQKVVDNGISRESAQRGRADSLARDDGHAAKDAMKAAHGLYKELESSMGLMNTANGR